MTPTSHTVSHTRPPNASESSAPPVHPAYMSAAAVMLFVVVTGAGLAADLLSKHYAFASLLNDPAVVQRAQTIYPQDYAGKLTPQDGLHLLSAQRDVFPGVRFTLSTNRGIAFGIEIPRLAIGVATLLAMGLVAALFAASDRKAHWTHVAMGLILAGALGNLYDRLLGTVPLPISGMEPIRYQVRDFIDLSQLHYKWIFNVADALLAAGIATIALQKIRAAHQARNAPRQAA